MLEKILGVSPAQKGLAQDSKVADQKNLQPDFKKDFERQLQKKLDDKSKFLKENEKNPQVQKRQEAKEPKKNEAEFRADHKDKKPSGEVKKKMVESDEEKMISNVMALPKNEFEIPDEKINLATIETDGKSENANKVDIAATKAGVDANAIFTKTQDEKLNLNNDISEQLKAAGIAMPEINETSNVAEDVEIKSAEAKTDELFQQQVLNPFEQKLADLKQASGEIKASAEKVSAQDQLSQEVGFDSDLKQHVAQAGLVQKMKEFEAEKGLTAEKSQDFEQKVLEKLQQDKSTLVGLNSEAKQKSSDSESQKDGSQDSSLKDIQADSLKPDANLHTGQAHSDFKAHLSSPIDKAGSPTAMSQLLDKREENVQEVMKQAKFLAVKGGGEMTVKMSPDGMGEIQLKVLMQDGKLTIDMQTQDKSVKKLIEDNLSELKSGLAAQQVHVDHVKITSVSGTNTDNSAQFQPSQDQSGAQQQQKDFWRNFQENFGSQSRRSSYADVGAVKSRTPSDPTALEPIKTNAARTYGRTGSTINRVA